MLTDQLHQEIITFVEAQNSEVFVIDLRLNRGKKNSLCLRIDTDDGISMVECARINKLLGPWLDEENLLDIEYGLEVSSPGVGEPLILNRQYKKNIGRLLKVVLEAGGEVIGKLAGVTENHIEVLPYKKSRTKDKSRKPEFSTESKEIRLDDIKESKVILNIR